MHIPCPSRGSSGIRYTAGDTVHRVAISGGILPLMFSRVISCPSHLPVPSCKHSASLIRPCGLRISSYRGDFASCRDVRAFQFSMPVMLGICLIAISLFLHQVNPDFFSILKIKRFAMQGAKSVGWRGDWSGGQGPSLTTLRICGKCMRTSCVRCTFADIFQHLVFW